MFFKKKNEYVEWDFYKKRVDFLDDFYFRQGVRNGNLKV